VIFLHSLCSSAFCSGFVGQTRPVSPLNRVYSQDISHMGIYRVYHFREITFGHLSYVPEYQECERREATPAQGLG